MRSASDQAVHRMARRETDGMQSPAGKFKILSNDDMPVVAFALKPDEDRSYDEYDIMERLREYR